MTYELMNSTLAGSDISYFFIYANSVTKGFFVPLIVLSFFIIVFVGSLFAQQRVSGRIKPENSLLASTFVALGLEILFSQKNGILNPIWFIITLAIFILSLIWVFTSSNEPY